MVQPMIISHMTFVCLMPSDRTSIQDLATQTAFDISMAGSNSVMVQFSRLESSQAHDLR